MNLLDLILLVPIIALGIYGYQRGIFRQIFSLGGLIAASGLGFYANRAFILDLWQDGDVQYFSANLLSIIIIIVVVVILFMYLGHLLTKFFKSLYLGLVVRILGAALGVAKGLLVTLLIAFVIQAISLYVPEWKLEMRNGSFLLPYLQDINALLLGYITGEGTLKAPDYLNPNSIFEF